MINTIQVNQKQKKHVGKCIVCKREEHFVTNLVIFPSGNFAHLKCYPQQIKIR